MSYILRSLALLGGVAWWAYLSVPRFDVERRSSARYRKALGICRNIWIGSGCIALILIQVFPASAISVCLVLSLLATFLCYGILDEVR